MSMQRLSRKEVLKLIEDCGQSGGDVRPYLNEVVFYAESAPTFRATFLEGKPIALVLEASAAGFSVDPPIPVTVEQAYALSDLENY